MALLYIDGFDYYSTAQAAIKYPGISGASIESTGGRRGSGALRFNYTGTITPAIIQIAPAQSALYCGFAFYNGWSSFQGGSLTNPAWAFRATGGGRQLVFIVLSDGRIRAQRGTTVLGVTSNTLVPGQWYYIELYATASTTVGQVQIYVNEVQWLSLTNQDTLEQGAGQFGQVQIAGCNGTNSNDVKYDDLYVHNSARLGDCRIDLLYPNGPGNYTQWTPNVGANWQAVDEIPASDSDYVYTSTVGFKDSYTFSDLPTGGGMIYGVAVNMYAAKTSSTVRGVRPLVRLGTTDYEGNEAVLTTGSAFYSHIWENNPQTATTWQEAEINSAQFGVKLST